MRDTAEFPSLWSRLKGQVYTWEQDALSKDLHDKVLILE